MQYHGCWGRWPAIRSPGPALRRLAMEGTILRPSPACLVARGSRAKDGGGGGSRTPVLERNRGSYYMLSLDLNFRPGNRRQTGLFPSLSSCWFSPLGPDARLCGQPDVVASGPLSGVRAETSLAIKQRVRTLRSHLLFLTDVLGGPRSSSACNQR